MASLTAIAILIRWQTAILFTIIGVAIAVQYCEMYMNISSLNDHTDNLQLQITYSLLLISVLLLSFFKQKQEENKITELKVSKLDNKLDDQKLELIKSQELKDEFLRNLQHEIRTPVTGITSIGQVLWDNYDKFTEQQRRSAIKEIAESSERLVSLVNNMVDLSKLKSLTYELSCTKVNLSELIYQRSEICRKIYLNDKELEFIYDIQDNVMVNCDKHYIISTLDNLITNAISYSHEGTITFSFRKEENFVKFNITDEGLGIPPQELHHIFGTFMVSSRTKTPSGGRGLGLALCKKVIEAHKGQIWCESDGKNGSSFTFVIPHNT
jgi:signal transduction histidine kinase